MTATRVRPASADYEMEVIDPATQSVLAVRKSTTAGELHSLAEQAHATFKDGRASDSQLRARCVNAWADQLETHREEVARLLVRETGKIAREADREVELSVDALRYNAGLCRHIDGSAAMMDDYLFVLVPGDRQISWPKLRDHLGVKRLSMPDADTAREVTGYERGTITPFGSLHAWPVIAGIRIVGTVSIGAGGHGLSATVSAKQLVAALGAVVVNVTDAV